LEEQVFDVQKPYIEEDKGVADGWGDDGEIDIRSDQQEVINIENNVVTSLSAVEQYNYQDLEF
jgi:hypothetical protein